MLYLVDFLLISHFLQQTVKRSDTVRFRAGENPLEDQCEVQQCGHTVAQSDARWGRGHGEGQVEDEGSARNEDFHAVENKDLGSQRLDQYWGWVRLGKYLLGCRFT